MFYWFVVNDLSMSQRTPGLINHRWNRWVCLLQSMTVEAMYSFPCIPVRSLLPPEGINEAGNTQLSEAINLLLLTQFGGSFQYCKTRLNYSVIWKIANQLPVQGVLIVPLIYIFMYRQSFSMYFSGLKQNMISILNGIKYNNLMQWM